MIRGCRGRETQSYLIGLRAGNGQGGGVEEERRRKNTDYYITPLPEGKKNGRIKRDVGKPRKTQDAASERHAVGCHRSNEIDGSGSMRDWPSGVAVGGAESISVWEEQRRAEKERRSRQTIAML